MPNLLASAGKASGIIGSVDGMTCLWCLMLFGARGVGVGLADAK
jgi:hypothetical protein